MLFVVVTFTSTAQNRANNIDGVAVVKKFYPNPATTAINFEFSTDINKPYSLQLFNFMGRKIYETSIGLQRIIIPLNGFFRGVYIYQLRDRFGKIVDSGKFQVVK